MLLTSEELVLLNLSFFLGILRLLSINTDMLVELNRTKQANYQNQIMVNFEQISQECGNFSLRILLLLLQQLETYGSGSGSG